MTTAAIDRTRRFEMSEVVRRLDWLGPLVALVVLQQVFFRINTKIETPDKENAQLSWYSPITLRLWLIFSMIWSGVPQVCASK